MQILNKKHELPIMPIKYQQTYPIINQGKKLYIKQPNMDDLVILFAGIKENVWLINNIFNDN